MDANRNLTRTEGIAYIKVKWQWRQTVHSLKNMPHVAVRFCVTHINFVDKITSFIW